MATSSARGNHGPYALCGWRVQSQLPLPELRAWDADAQGARRLRIELGAAPEAEQSGFSILPGGDARVRISGLADFLIQAGAPGGEDAVVVEMAADADPLLVRSFLYGTVLAVLCYKRGLLPLHGSSVLIGGAAVVFSGPSGAGKSALATALARRGHALLSDDVCAIDLSDPVRPVLWPAIARVKLQADAIEAFHLGAASAYTRAPCGEKGHFGVAALDMPEANGGPASIAAAYALDAADGEAPERVPLRGKDRFAFLDGQAHRAGVGRELGLQAQLFRCVAALARAVPVYRLRRPRSLERLDEVAAFLEATARPAPPARDGETERERKTAWTTTV